jgi:hypothetical protein
MEVKRKKSEKKFVIGNTHAETVFVTLWTSFFGFGTVSGCYWMLKMFMYKTHGLYKKSLMGSHLTITDLILVHSNNPSSPHSFPYPDCFSPPKGNLIVSSYKIFNLTVVQMWLFY